MTKMTHYQADLLAKLTASWDWKNDAIGEFGVGFSSRIVAKFNGDFLNCRVAISQSLYSQRFSFVFDSAGDCQGSRLVPGSLRGAYSELFARRAAKVIIEHSRAIGAEQLS